jgi:rod shape-determining protein MreD
MRWILWICLAAFVVAAQTTIAPLVQIGGVRPDWPFLLVVAIALTAPGNQALYASALVGLFVDLNTLVPLGVFTLTYGLAALLMLQVRELLFRDALLTYVLVTLIVGLLAQGAVALLRLAQEGAGQYAGSVVLETLGITVYTAMWSFPAHWLFLKLGRPLGLTRVRKVRFGTL